MWWNERTQTYSTLRINFVRFIQSTPGNGNEYTRLVNEASLFILPSCNECNVASSVTLCYYDTNRTNIAFMRPQYDVIVSLYETRHLDALCYRDPAPVINPLQSPSAINGDPPPNNTPSSVWNRHCHVIGNLVQSVSQFVFLARRREVGWGKRGKDVRD